MLTPSTTTLTDVRGEPHEYMTTPFQFDESIDLKLKILGIILRPLGDAIGAAIGGAKTPAEDLAEDPAGSTFALGELVDDIDWSQLGPILQQIPVRLVEAGGSALIAEILKTTIRNTKGAAAGGQTQKLMLNKPANRTIAYSGGNQVEAYKAIGWVLAVNFAPFAMDDSGDFKGFSGLSSAWSSLIREKVSTAKPAINSEPTEPDESDTSPA